MQAGRGRGHAALRDALRPGRARGPAQRRDAGARPHRRQRPLRAWRRADPDAADGHAPAHHPTRFLRGYRAHTPLCRGAGLPLFVIVAPANAHDAPFAPRLLAWAVALDQVRPRVIRLAAAYWGLRLIHWIHTALGAVAVIPWNPTRQKNRDRLPPTWPAAALGKRGGIERCFGRVFRCFDLQRPPVCGWTAVVRRGALTYAATIVVALAATGLAARTSSARKGGCWPISGRAACELGNALK
jgi:hypothetical protein